MELKPLFPDKQDLMDACEGVSNAEYLVLSLPIEVQPELHDEALMDLKNAYLFIHAASDNSIETYRAYRGAIERLYLFLWLKRGKTLGNSGRADFLAFTEFAKNPDIEWVGIHARRFHEITPNPEWRPFSVKPPKGKTQEDTPLIYQTSEATIKSLVSRLNSFYGWLVGIEYIPSNPIAQIKSTNRTPGKRQEKKPVKRLSPRQLSYCKIEADLMATEMPELHERTRFIIHFMLSTYVRISEMVPGERHEPSMSDFSQDSNNNWWFFVVGGKSHKDRMIPMSNADVAALARYRASRNLSPYPSHDEDEPLILRLDGTGQVTSTRNIRMIVQKCFDRTKRRLQEDGHTEDASNLHDATVHWLRHTGISEDLNSNNRLLVHVADDAGHEDLKTTSLYIDTNFGDRHSSKQSKASDAIAAKDREWLQHHEEISKVD